MIEGCGWRNNILDFPLGICVMIRPTLNTNSDKRRMALQEHLDKSVYIVEEIH